MIELNADQRPILMLVTGDPDNDPRIGWVRDLCRQFGRVQIEGAVRRAQVARDYDGIVETNRFDASLLAKGIAPVRRRIAKSRSVLKASNDYAERMQVESGGRWDRRRSLSEYAADEIGGAARFTLQWARLAVSIEGLYRQGRALSVRPRLMICHDLYALVAAVRLKPHLRCPILYDSHEFWSQGDLLARGRQVRRVERLEGRLVRHADAVITVSPPLARAIEHLHGITGVVTVPNAAPWDSSASPPQSVGDPVEFLLQGRAAPGRGFELLLDGWRSVDARRAHLSIRCPDSPHLEVLRTEFSDLIASGAVSFVAPVERTALIAEARYADVGIIPYIGPNLNHLYACPNKLSEYMHAGLAILSNRLEFVGQVIGRAACGAMYDARGPSTVSAAVAELVADREELLAKKRRAFDAARAWFNWDVQSRPYADTVRSLIET